MTMTVPKILDELTFYTGEFPRAAVEAAVERREEMVPELLRLLDEAIEEPETLRDPEFMGHLYALYLLSQFREPAAFQRLLRLVRLSADVVDAALGDLVTEDLPRMLAFLADGDAASIRALVEDPEVGEWVRGSAVTALEEMVFAGLLSREEVVAYLGELLRGRLEREYSNVWNCVVSAALDLHATELAADVRRAFTEGLVEPFCISAQDIAEELAEERAIVLERSRRRSRGPIVDTVAEMSCWTGFREGGSDRSTPSSDPYVREGRKVGRNEPCPCGSGKKHKKCCLRAG
jgi:hypothetical protein